MAARDDPFSGRTIAGLIGVGAVAFLAMAYLLIYGEAGDPYRRSGPNAFSTSAIGHRAFIELLRRLDVPVLANRRAEVDRGGDRSLVVVAEPPNPAQLEEALKRADTNEPVLLVLPKWRGLPNLADPQWLAEVRLLPESSVQPFAQALTSDATIVRPSSVSGWRGRFADRVPELTSPQLVKSARLTPLIATEQGILLGEWRGGGRRVWILSDPDIIANHGLWRGNNPHIAVAVVNALRTHDGAVVFDELVHGFRVKESLWRLILEPPFVLATLMLIVTMGLLVWSAAIRFGPVLPAAPPLESGRETLIRATAGLTRADAHGAAILRRYFTATVHDVAQRLHAPPGISAGRVSAWIDRIGKARGVHDSHAALSRDIDAALGARTPDAGRLVMLARRLHRWKQELLHGP
jgi:hypothetical protein